MREQNRHGTCFFVLHDYFLKLFPHITHCHRSISDFALDVCVPSFPQFPPKTTFSSTQECTRLRTIYPKKIHNKGIDASDHRRTQDSPE